MAGRKEKTTHLPKIHLLIRVRPAYRTHIVGLIPLCLESTLCCGLQLGRQAQALHSAFCLHETKVKDSLPLVISLPGSAVH